MALLVGGRIAGVCGVPNGLIARHLQDSVTDDEGGQRSRRDRRGNRAVRRAVLVSGAPLEGHGAYATAPPTAAADRVAATFGHRRVRAALATTTRKRTAQGGVAGCDLGVALARAGLVMLHVDITVDANGLTAQPWGRWERTDAGDTAHSSYADALASIDPPIAAYAIAASDGEGATVADDPRVTARQALDAIRARAADRGRPEAELRYLERLLERF